MYLTPQVSALRVMSLSRCTQLLFLEGSDSLPSSMREGGGINERKADLI